MGDAPGRRWLRPALGPGARRPGATHLRPRPGGPRGCAPRLRSPRRAARPRRSTPPVATAAAGAGCRCHHRAHRRRRRAELPLPPARRPTRRSEGPGRHPAGRPRPSAVARTPRPGQHRPTRVRPARHLLGAGGVAGVVAMTPPSNPRRRLGATGPAQQRPPARFSRGQRRPPARFSRGQRRPPARFSRGQRRPPARFSRGQRRCRPARFSRGERGARTPRHDRHGGPTRPGGSCRLTAASCFALARRRGGRHAVGRRHPSRSVPVDLAGPIARNHALAEAEPDPAAPFPRPRGRSFGASTDDRHHVDRAPGRRGWGRRLGSWSVPWRSSVLAPRRAPA
jgi:hypothetical protein